MKFAFFPLIVLALATMSSCKKKTECVINDPVPGCGCPAVYDPVCGCDGKTYGNDCEANCAGVTEYKPGACK